MKKDRKTLENAVKQLRLDLDAVTKKRKDAAWDEYQAVTAGEKEKKAAEYTSLFVACAVLDEELKKAESDLIKYDSKKWDCDEMIAKQDNLIIHKSGDVYTVNSSGIASLWCSKDSLSAHVRKLNQIALRR